MWDEARQVVESLLFKDKIEIYEETFSTNQIGEEISQLNLIGEFDCNIQYETANRTENVSGGSNPQSIRISLSKEAPIDPEKAYVIKILQARITFNQDKWKLIASRQAQLSTVLTARREVTI